MGRSQLRRGRQDDDTERPLSVVVVGPRNISDGTRQSVRVCKCVCVSVRYSSLTTHFRRLSISTSLVRDEPRKKKQRG